MPKEDPAALLISELLYFGLPVSAIADQAGISRAHVHRLSGGEVRNPGFGTVTKLQRLVDRTTKSASMPKAGIVTRRV
jgi:predicted transcriptional regulator